MSETVPIYKVAVPDNGTPMPVSDDPWALLANLAHADEQLRRALRILPTFARKAGTIQSNALNDALKALGRYRLQEAAHGR